MASSFRALTCRGRYLIVALVLLASVACLDDTVPESNPGLVSLVSSDTTDIADAFRQVLITATVDTKFRIANSTVNFTTTEGSFTSGGATATVAVNDSGFARVELKAPSDSSAAIVTATIVGRTRSLTIHFLPAPPTWITVVANAYEVTGAVGASVQLTATIGRAHGTPSSGTPVDFAFRLLGGGPLSGHLTKSSQFPAANESAVVSFVLDSPDTGTVLIRASATRGDTVRDSVQFKVVTKAP